MVHRNLGILDRLLRFALAVWWIGPWAPYYTNPWVNWAIFVVGWIALAEAFLGWCAIHTLFGIHDCDACEECGEEEESSSMERMRFFAAAQNDTFTEVSKHK